MKFPFTFPIRRRLLDSLVPGSANQSGMVPTGKIDVITPFYFVLCRRAILRLSEPTINLPYNGIYGNKTTNIQEY